jgi:DNA-binding transcriptional MerR regulator
LGGEGIRAQKKIPPHNKPSLSAPAQDSIERPLKIGEAAHLVGVEPYVLRFWETQFSFIRPKQSRSRHRYYSQGDVETLKFVKRLLHTEGYTIAGARRFVRENGLDNIKQPLPPQRTTSGRRTKEHLDEGSAAYGPDAALNIANNGVHRTLREIREDLHALHKLLETR